MSVFEPKKHRLREVLHYFFSVKKSVVESHRLLIEAYGQAALKLLKQRAVTGVDDSKG